VETLHYIVAVLSVLGGAFLYHQRLREQLLVQRMDMLDNFNREHADNCLRGLKEINEKLDKINDAISKHNAEYSVLRVEVDGIKEQVSHLNAWFSSVIDNK